MFSKAVSVLALYGLTAASAAFNVSKINPDTVDTLDLNKYVGYWYQMAADAYVMDTFEKDGYCVTAQYGLKEDGSVSVHNYDTLGSPTGQADVIDGYAYVPDAEKPGQLKVHFDSAGDFDAPYWVLSLGPENKDSLYDWAIVSDNLSAYLFVLARDVQTFNDQYKEEVYGMLTDLGFTGRKAPIDTYQGSDCVYEQ